MAPTLITPPEDVERAMASLFKVIERRDSSTKKFRDSDFDRISQLLAQLGKPGWAERPRTYAILRIIETPNSLQLFVDAELFDIAIPYSRARISRVLSRDIADRFLQNQPLALTAAYDLEAAGGYHQHLDHDGDAHFNVVRILGTGAFGQVDHVRGKIALQDYARKRIRRTKIEGIDSFMKELKSLKRLRHHHLVTLLGSYTDPRYVGLIVKEVADCNLKEYLEKSPFPEAERQGLRGFYGSLACAVAYLHRNKVRHKDLKPSNILIKDFQILIADFGAALDWSDRDRSTTKELRKQFTPAYMAPEVEDWQPRNSATDIYSLGLIFMDITTVLKGETFENRRKHFMGLSTHTEFHRTNPEASKSWQNLLQKKSSEDNQPLKWFREMTQDRPEDRIKAEILYKKILSFPGYFPICCEGNEDMDDNEDDHSYQNDTASHRISAGHSIISETFDKVETESVKNEPSSKDSIKSAKELTSEEEQQFLAAAKKGNLLWIKKFTRNGIDIETKDEIGRTALILAAQQGQISVINFLLDIGAKIEAQGTDGWNALHSAAYNGNHYEVKALLENRALIEAQNDDGKCALHLACENGHEEVVRTLLKNGADINRETFKGWTALLICAKGGHDSIARMLLDAPDEMPEVEEAANLEATVDEGSNCLHIAAGFGHPTMVELFLERGLDIESRTNFGYTPFHFAAKSNEKGVALLLLGYGASMEATTNDAFTPLYLAARAHSEDMALLLIDMGVNIEAVTLPLMMTPLHFAASAGELGILRMLISNGANVNASDSHEFTPLHFTSKEGSEVDKEAILACARLLLTSGADVNAQEISGLATLHLVAGDGNEEMANLLLEFGAAIHAEDNVTYRPLDFAALKDQERMVSFLIERGADIMNEGGRAMDLAISEGHEGVARILVKHGADVESYEGLKEALNLDENGYGEMDTKESCIPSKEDLEAIERLFAEDERQLALGPPRRESVAKPPVKNIKIDKGKDKKTEIGKEIKAEKGTKMERSTEKQNEPESSSNGDTEAIARLRKYGFDTALAFEAYSICDNDEEEAKDVLLELYEDFIECEPQTPTGKLREAVEKGDIAEMKIILTIGCDINEITKPDQTALMCAASKGRENFLKVLLDYGADVTITNSAGYTALHFATESGNETAAKLLLDNGADIEAKSKKGWTPIGCAAPSIQGFLEEYSATFKGKGVLGTSKNANVSVPSESSSLMAKSSISSMPEKNGSPTPRKPPPPVPKKSAELLKKYSKPLASSPKKEMTNTTAPSRRVSIIKSSLDPERTITITRLPSTEPRPTPALKRPKSSSSSAKTVTHRDGDWDFHKISPSRPKKTPVKTLLEAVSRGTALEVIAMLKKSNGVDITDDQGNTPLHLATTDGSELKVRLLIKHGADVNAINRIGNTPLHKASQMGNAQVVKLLFGSHARMGAKNNDGSTPLHLAAFYGNKDVVRFLLDCGAEVKARDCEGHDVLAAAKQGERLQAGNDKDHAEVVRILKALL